MLLNLDLFRSQPEQDEPGGGSSNSGGSTLDQIRTLNALGYLSDGNSTDATAGGRTSEGIESPPSPPSQEIPE